jgi:hypothetical protein
LQSIYDAVPDLQALFCRDPGVGAAERANSLSRLRVDQWAVLPAASTVAGSIFTRLCRHLSERIKPLRDARAPAVSDRTHPELRMDARLPATTDDLRPPPSDESKPDV